MVAANIKRVPQANAEFVRGPRHTRLLERFVSEKDPAALAALVEHFGGMVWGICRRLLPTDEDAEDAFQAVFLVMMKKAATIRNKEAVGSWLYGVAYRTAMRARRELAHRKRIESKATPPVPAPSPTGVASCRELQRVLDEEVNRLPPKLKAPFVLCCIEGMSKSEAAQELRWKEGTVSGRLAYARKLLQQRLTRRGITLSAVLTVLALTRETVAAAVPPLLVQATITGLSVSGAGQTAGVLSPAALSLAEGVVRALTVAKVKAIAAVLTISLALGGAAGAVNQLGQAPQAPAAFTEFYQNFRDSKPPELPLTLFGVKAAQVTHPAQRGLHIQVDPNPEQIIRVGVNLPARFHGDFEITAGYEIVRADVPEHGHGVGMSLLAELDSPINEVLELLRLARVNEDQVYGCARISGAPGDQKFHHHWFPTRSKAGHLRMTRRGAELTYSAREGGVETFEELFHLTCGTEDLQRIRFAAFLGHAPNSVDVYLKDLRVTAPGSGHPAVVDPGEPRAEAAVSPTRHRFSLIIFGLLFLFVLAAAGFWMLYSRRRKRGEGEK